MNDGFDKLNPADFDKLNPAELKEARCGKGVFHSSL
jgi:hypothetical protein